MKAEQIFWKLGIGLYLFLLGSCATSDVATNRGPQKRKYNRGWSTESSSRGVDGISHEVQTETFAERDPQLKENDPSFLLDNDISSSFETGAVSDFTPLDRGDDVVEITTITQETSLESPCDIIMLKNGEEIEAKVTEIGSYEIKYKLCNNLEGPAYTKNKSEIFKIKYANGTSVLISEIETNQPQFGTFNQSGNSAGGHDTNKPLKIMAITGIILGGLSFLLFGLLFSLCAIGLGITALILLNKKPVEQRSKKVRNLSLWSIAIGIVTLGLTIFIYLW